MVCKVEGGRTRAIFPTISKRIFPFMTVVPQKAYTYIRNGFSFVRVISFWTAAICHFLIEEATIWTVDFETMPFTCIDVAKPI